MQSHEANSSRWKRFLFACRRYADSRDEIFFYRVIFFNLWFVLSYIKTPYNFSDLFIVERPHKRNCIFIWNFLTRSNIPSSVVIRPPTMKRRDVERAWFELQDSRCRRLLRFILGGIPAVPLCVQICVIIDTRWDHELKHEWVLIRRSLPMSSIVQNLYYSRGERKVVANEVASGNATNAERVDNDRLFLSPSPRISPRCPIGNVKRSLYAAILVLSSFCTMTSTEKALFSLFSKRNYTILCATLAKSQKKKRERERRGSEVDGEQIVDIIFVTIFEIVFRQELRTRILLGISTIITDQTSSKNTIYKNEARANI